MQFILAAHTDEDQWRKMTKEQQDEGAAALVAYLRELADAGELVGTYRPEPSSQAKTVRFVDGGTEIQDGPYADLAEPMTGLSIIDVPDEEDALLWAERHPATQFGAIEVRPIAAGKP
jgi:hypothetical protein